MVLGVITLVLRRSLVWQRSSELSWKVDLKPFVLSVKANFGSLNEKELTRSDEQRGISSMNQFDFHRFKYFPGLGRNYSWAGLHGTLPDLPVVNSTSSFCSKYKSSSEVPGGWLRL